MHPKNRDIAKWPLLALVLLLLPNSAFAHGEEIILKMFLLVGALLVSAVLLVLLILYGKLTLASKAVLTTVFLVAAAATIAIWFSLSYQQYQTPIDLLINMLPATSIVVAYAIIRFSQRSQLL